VDHQREGACGVMSEAAPAVGREFAAALAAKDFDRIATQIVDPEIDFRGLTPKRAWEASTAEELVAKVLTSWLEETDHVDELVEVETDDFADRHRIGYSMRGHNEDGPFVFEQQAYFTERNGRIDWMRILCSGFRPV
jgi:hypothetical protein